MPSSGRVIPTTVGVRSLPGVLLTLGYAMMVAGGIFGEIYEPNTSVSDVAGASIMGLAWNVALILSGMLGVFARIHRLPRVEVVTVETLATVLILWAGFVLMSKQVSDQSAYLLTAVALLMYGWAAGTRRYLSRRSRVIDGGEAQGET